MKKTLSAASLDDRYRSRASTILKIAKWPAIGALIGGGALIIGHIVGPAIADIVGPAIADELGAQPVRASRVA